MPIGKNIKKDTIIPSAKKKVEKEKTVVKPKKAPVTVPEVDAESIANREKVIKVAERIAEQASAKKKDSAERSELQKKRVGTARYMTDEEFQERERLKSKFDNEAKTYAGRELQLISFRLGEERYAIEIGRLKEVVPTPKISRIPHAPHYVTGVSNIRGNVMVIIDLAKKFELENIDKDQSTQFTLVVQSEDFRAGVLIGEVPTTLKVKGENIVSSSGILNNTALDETYIKGLIKTDDEMIIFIDIIELITDDEISIISQAINRG